MSSMSLRGRKKVELVSIANSLGIDHDGLIKAEIEGAIQQHLQKHPKLITDDDFKPLYGAQATERPQAAATGEEAYPEKKPRRKSISTATQNKVTLPASPEQVTDMIEINTRAIARNAKKWAPTKSGTKLLQTAQKSLSRPLTVEFLAGTVEAFAILSETIPWNREVPFPPLAALGFSETFKVPDLFAVLRFEEFWRPLLLLLLLMVAFPLALGFLVNRTTRRKQIDPLSFSVGKLLVYYFFITKNHGRHFLSTRDIEMLATSLAEIPYFTSSVGVIYAMYDAILTRR